MTSPRGTEAPTLRVCQVIDRLTGGGQERVAAQLAAALATRVGTSGLLATRGGGDYERMLHPPVQMLIMRRSARFDLRSWSRIALWLRQRRFRIVHVHSPGSLAAMVLLRRTRVIDAAIVLHLQMLPPPGTAFRRRAMRWNRRARRHVAHAFVTNDRLRRYLIDDCAYDVNAVTILPNATDFGETPRRDDESTPRNRRPRIAMVAQWRPQKDHITAIQAAARVRAAGYDAEWLLIGEEDEQSTPAARSLIHDLGLGEHVKITGRRSDVRELLRDCSIGVLATHFEGSPVVVAEYAAAELPVVVSVVEGTDHLVAPEDGIIGVAPGDADDLASAVLSLLERPEEAGRLGVRAHRRMRAMCDLPVIVEGLLETYTRVLSDARAQGSR